jgi:very-short-patch-repair endonuclease
MTEPERRLWSVLRNRHLHGVKFSRQVVIGSFIADFCAREHGLIVEVDGDTHAGDGARDERRTAWLKTQGYRVIRFTNADVMSNLDGVLYAIGVALVAPPHPSPLPAGEREQVA